LFQAAKIKHRN